MLMVSGRDQRKKVEKLSFLIARAADGPGHAYLPDLVQLAQFPDRKFVYYATCILPTTVVL